MVEAGSTILGAVIAILSLSVPIGGVMADRPNLPVSTMADSTPALSHEHQQPGPLPSSWAGPFAGGDHGP
jgi:hypothetical protein